MTRHRHYQPICHESRDLGYARKAKDARRKLTVFLTVLLAVLVWLLWREITK